MATQQLNLELTSNLRAAKTKLVDVTEREEAKQQDVITELEIKLKVADDKINALSFEVKYLKK